MGDKWLRNANSSNPEGEGLKLFLHRENTFKRVIFMERRDKHLVPMVKLIFGMEYTVFRCPKSNSALSQSFRWVGKEKFDVGNLEL